MSQTTGKTSTYIKNANVKESTQIQTGFKNTRFLHEAAAGDTLIQLTSLTTPAGVVNYSAPSVSDLSQTNLMQWSSNLTLSSTDKGLLFENISYVVTGATTIKLLFEALDGEVFEGKINHQARTGTTLVDASPIVATGTLAAGLTDFNVGTPFQVGLYSSNQIGAVMVFVDGVLMDRNTGNNPMGAGVEGDYYEVHSGGGLGQIIRLNSPDLINDRQIKVVSVNGLVERPNGSLMAVMESVQGQVDAMVPTLAALADVAETTFQAAPNNVDLKTFGDRVFTLEKILDQEIETRKTFVLKDIKSSGVAGDVASTSYADIILNTVEGDNSIVSLSSNQFTLQAGTYYISGFVPAISTTTAAVKYHKAKLFNITDGVDVILGTSSTTSDNTADIDTTESFIVGTFTLASQKTFSIRHRASTVNMTRGQPSSFGDSEVYSTFEIVKFEKKTIRQALGL